MSSGVEGAKEAETREARISGHPAQSMNILYLGQRSTRNVIKGAPRSGMETARTPTNMSRVSSSNGGLWR